MGKFNKIIKLKILHWLAFWVDLVCDLVGIVTFCYIYPNWSLLLRTYLTKVTYINRIKKG